MASFRQRGDKWMFSIDVGKDPITGNRRQRTVTKDDNGKIFYNERDARKFAAKMEQEIERGKRFDSITLADFTRQYFEKEVRGSVAESTYFHQLRCADDYIIPALGHRMIDKITDGHLDTVIDKFIADGVSKGYIRNIAMVMSKILNHARKKKHIIDNPMKLVTIPTYKAPKMKVWTVEEARLFREITKDSKLHIFYVLALSTGARRGELLSLTWDDVSFERGTVTITKSLIYTKESKRHVSDTKTENSKRTIRIPKYALEALEEHRKKQMIGVKLIVDNLGEYHYPNDVTRYFNNDVRKFGLPKIRLHDMRHTHATHLFQQRFNPAVVAERLGDTVAMVMKTYAHVLPSMQDEVANVLDEMN